MYVAKPVTSTHKLERSKNQPTPLPKPKSRRILQNIDIGARNALPRA
jgi:hypothetical protein